MISKHRDRTSAIFLHTGRSARSGAGILLLSLVLVAGSGVSLWGQELQRQRLSLSLRDASLETALNTLSEKAAIPISFSSELLPQKRITVRFQRQSVAYILDHLLAGAQLSWQVVGNQIVVFKAPPVPVERRHTISGFLRDAASGEPLIGAAIWERRTGKGAATNEYGFFSLTLPGGEAVLRFSYTGYEYLETPLTLRRDTSIAIEMRGAIMLTEVVVRAGRNESPPFTPNLTPLEITDAEAMPALAGEPDVMRALHFMPGVQTGTDGIEGLHVRGGSQGHNLVLIDGVPVYNYSHAAGIFSVFNTAAVRSIRFVKGGFPARYGGRLASVIDVRTKEGNMRTFQGRADVGLLSSRLTLEGPIVKDKSAFFISGRTSLINWYLRPLSRDFKARNGEEGQTLYQFDDFNAKINYAFSDKDKLYLSLYKGRDQFDNRGFAPQQFSIFNNNFPDTLRFRYDRSYRDEYQWGNTIGSLRWNHLLGKKMFANTTATFSRLDVNIRYEEADSLLLLNPALLLGRSINVGRYSSGIEERGLRFDLDYVPSPGHYWRFGAGLTSRAFRPGALVYDERNEGGNPGLANRPSEATELTFYAEDEFRIGNTITVNAGVHLASWNVGSRKHNSLQPRFAVNWQPAKWVLLRAAHSTMAQFLHFLTNSDIGLPTDLWAPSTANIAPEEARQNEIGLDVEISRELTLSLDAYHKRMSNLLAFSEGASFLNDWEQNVTPGTGEAYGLEALLHYRSERTTAWVAYSLARSERQFERINLGRVFPFKYDRRHDLKLAAAHRLRPWLLLSANWTLSSGFAYSLPLTEFTFQIPGQPLPPVIVPDFGSKNRYRMPWYHRLDASAQFSFRSKKLEHLVTAGVYNAYNRRNPLYYNLRTRLENVNNELIETKSFVQVWLLPVLPSLSYSVRF